MILLKTLIAHKANRLKSQKHGNSGKQRMETAHNSETVRSGIEDFCGKADMGR